MEINNVENLKLMNQTHSNNVFFLDEKNKNLNKIKSDSLVTNVNGVALGVLTADCVPILMYDKQKTIVAAIHAGWKGAYKGIVTRVVNFFLKNDSSPKNIMAAIGHCISLNSYAVKKDVKQKVITKDKKDNLIYKKIKNKKNYH